MYPRPAATKPVAGIVSKNVELLSGIRATIRSDRLNGLVPGKGMGKRGWVSVSETRVRDRRTPWVALRCCSGPQALLLGPAIGEQGKKFVAGRSGTESRKSRENVPQVGEGVPPALNTVQQDKSCWLLPADIAEHVGMDVEANVPDVVKARW